MTSPSTPSSSSELTSRPNSLPPPVNIVLANGDASLHSGVHFAQPFPHRSSIASLRENGHTLTPPRSVIKARSSSPIRSPPTSPIPGTAKKANGHVPILAHRASSHERRVASEAGPSTRSARSGSLIANGKRASVVTGGYETSDAEGEPDTLDRDNAGPSIPAPSRPVNGLGIRSHSDKGRTRSKSLVSPVVNEHASLEQTRHPHRQPSHHSRTSSFRNHPPSRVASHQSARNGLPPSRSDSFFASAGPSRTPSTSHVPREASEAKTIRNKDIGRVRREEGASSPDSRKGKARRVDGLAASLGLDSDAGNIALTPDQINNLLSDSDVASALRLMNQSHLAPRYSLGQDPLSPSSSRRQSRPSSPEHTFREPYIAQAPPPLVQSESPARRDRNVSISSSIAPSPRQPWSTRQRSIAEEGSSSVAERRRRASSRVSEGGHIPYTHHVPVVQVDEEPSDHETGSLRTAETPPTVASEFGETARDATATPASKKGGTGMKGKSRLSQLFHIGKKKSGEDLSRSHSHRVLVKVDKEQEHRDKEKERERYERDVERRRLEQERRDAELAQERRFKALTQVAAHPTSERLAYYTSSHLRAYYNNIYDGIDNPPKVNALAVLRWKHRTDEQAGAKRKWDEAGKLSPARPASPKLQGHYGHIHASPGSLGGSESMRDSTELERLLSRSPGRSPGHSTPGRSAGSSGTAKWWQYTVEDVAAYNAAGGVVNYFIPPRPPAEQRMPSSSSNLDVPNGSQRAASPKPHEEESSLGGSVGKKSDVAQMRIASASTASLAGGMSMMSHDSAPLSRASSNASAMKSQVHHREQRLGHRTHHSLSAMGQSGLGHALKAPFEKLGSVARKQNRAGTAPYPLSVGDEHREDSFLVEQSPHLSVKSDNQHHLGIHKPSRLNGSTPLKKQPSTKFKSNGGSLTDDDRRERDFHLRKLFLKGQRVFPFDPKRPDPERIASNGAKEHDRVAELLALEKALAREAEFRERQAEVDRRTQMEAEARARMRQLEDEIYAERLQHMRNAKAKLYAINTNYDHINESVRHYLAQIDQLSGTAKVSAQVDIRFPNLDPLRIANDKIPSTRGESSDVLSPLRQLSAYDSASGSEARRTPSRQGSGPKRRGAAHPLPALHSVYGSKPWPRRTAFAPKGSESVDPIRRLELCIEYAKDQQVDIVNQRDSTARQLERMVWQIADMMKTNESARGVIKGALDKHRAHRVEIRATESRLRGRTSAVWSNLSDWGANKGVGAVLIATRSMLSWITFYRWITSRRSKSAREDWRKSAPSGLPLTAYVNLFLLVAFVGIVVQWSRGEVCATGRWMLDGVWVLLAQMWTLGRWARSCIKL